jgi:hypothetical protein
VLNISSDYVQGLKEQNLATAAVVR